MVRARVAVAKSYFDAYARLPKRMQKKAKETLEQFTQNPTSPGLNFETLPGMRDSKVRSIRVDGAYRMIIVKPPRGDMFLAVWVDNHDEAYDWASRKSFEVNPVSGVLQVYSIEESRDEALGEEAHPAAIPDSSPSLFESVEDENLLLAGVPEPLLPSVRGLKTEYDLDALAPHLPADACDMLYLVAAGVPSSRHWSRHRGRRRRSPPWTRTTSRRRSSESSPRTRSTSSRAKKSSNGCSMRPWSSGVFSCTRVSAGSCA